MAAAPNNTRGFGCLVYQRSEVFMKKSILCFLGVLALTLAAGSMAMAESDISADAAFDLMRAVYVEREKPAFNALSFDDPHYDEYQAALCETYKDEGGFWREYRANCR
jgi:hypothetical protein